MRVSRASFKRVFNSRIPLSSSHSFDKEGFSVWRVDFKYNSELTQTFMSSNQIGGFFNRLEASRKYLFGSMGVLGKANDSVISGALILRGQDVKPVIDVAPDWESYEYKKLDLENPEDKAFFEAALAWDLEIDGKKWVDGKNVSALRCLRPCPCLTSPAVQVKASPLTTCSRELYPLLCCVFLDHFGVVSVLCSNFKKQKDLEHL